MFLIIGIWGSRQRKIHAVFMFFFYTVLGSVLLLVGILLVYKETGTLNFGLLKSIHIDENLQIFIWLLFFFGFSVKVPLVPFHIWLPEAHVEAPTAGSVILASVLLKVGTFGMLRFILPNLGYASGFFLPFVFTISVVSILYSSFAALAQTDIKKIIAYSSVAHMGFVVIGLFSFNYFALVGSLFLMVSHAFVSSSLFICVGVLYDRFHTKNIIYYGGLVFSMPLFSILFFLSVLSNFSFPGSSNFIGELFVLFGVVECNFFLVYLLVASIILTTVYNLWMFNRVVFFRVGEKIFGFFDLSLKEFLILIILLILNFFFGLYPNFFFSFLEFPVFDIITSF
jgi:NADH-quinone oxidoreductase subunit M